MSRNARQIGGPGIGRFASMELEKEVYYAFSHLTHPMMQIQAK